jgi:hypothetical protein
MSISPNALYHKNLDGPLTFYYLWYTVSYKSIYYYQGGQKDMTSGGNTVRFDPKLKDKLRRKKHNRRLNPWSPLPPTSIAALRAS